MDSKNKLKRLLKEYVQEVILSESSINQGRQFTSRGEHVTVLEKPSEEKKPGFFNMVDITLNNLEGQIALDNKKAIKAIDLQDIKNIRNLSKEVEKTDDDDKWNELLDNLQPLYMMMTKGGRFKVNPKSSAS